MSRWIAFDDQTAAAIKDRAGSAELHSGDPLQFALNLATPSLVVLPSAGKVLLARLRPIAKKKEPHIVFEASGFLGLSDNPVLLDDAPEPPKKKWWQRFKAA